MDTLAFVHLTNDYPFPYPLNNWEESVVYNSHSTHQLFLNPSTSSSNSSFSHLKFISAVAFLSLLGFPSIALASLQRGDRGSNVNTLQTTLSKKGYFKGPISGFFGEVTEAAVIRFQKANGLNPDGIVGSLTESALKSGLSPRNRQSTQTSTNPNVGGPAVGSSGVLRQGDEGGTVRSLQQTLKQLNYYQGAITGFFGPMTHEAVLRFQSANGLNADGLVGSATKVALTTNSKNTSKANPTPPYTGVGGTTVPITNVPLRQGDRGSTVASLQQTLKQLNYYQGAITGFFGPMTHEAVILFQRQIGLNANGIVDPQTLSALESEEEMNSTTSVDTGGLAVIPNPVVLDLQQKLKTLGYYVGSIDGTYGSQTETAIRNFQAGIGLPPTGLLDPETQSSLDRSLADG